MIVVQADEFSDSLLATVMVVPLTSNLGLAHAPGNVLLSAREPGLLRPSAANVSQVLTIDRSFLESRVRALNVTRMGDLEAGLRLSLAL